MLIRSRPEPAKATIVAEPEYLAETLPYYIDNPIYLTREHIFWTYVRFTKEAQLDGDLGETLKTSQDLRAQVSSGNPDAAQAEENRSGADLSEGLQLDLPCLAPADIRFPVDDDAARRIRPCELFRNL
ncbi:hypothetical protein [Rhizobium laguerreae]|uniref:hypothetical protein n=1 Tax=Rhizobium laguerreae TaxID=1076926 RepID=UPI0021B0D50B|nr:hypothetical protein [Rhizobium laguerreae]